LVPLAETVQQDHLASEEVMIILLGHPGHLVFLLVAKAMIVLLGFFVITLYNQEKGAPL
jgi:hypothetical protein